MDNQNYSCVKIPKKNPSAQLPFPIIQPEVHHLDFDYDHDKDKDRDKDKHKEKCDDYNPIYEKPYDQPHDKHEVCKRPERVIPNPVFPANATLPLLTPLAVRQVGNTVFVTASIPAEAIITLPTEALEIKRISKKLKITQCRFLDAPAAIAPGFPQDTPKLFLGGFVRKDIQFSQMKKRTMTTVEGDIRDFVVDIPVSGVVNLGTGLVLPDLQFDQEREFEFARRRRLGEGFPDKERLLSPDFTEFNVTSNKFLNRLPHCELIFSQISEMDDQLDREPLCGGPFEEGTFRTLQEKMVIVVQVALTFPILPVAGLCPPCP